MVKLQKVFCDKNETKNYGQIPKNHHEIPKTHPIHKQDHKQDINSSLKGEKSTDSNLLQTIIDMCYMLLTRSTQLKQKFHTTLLNSNSKLLFAHHQSHIYIETIELIRELAEIDRDFPQIDVGFQRLEKYMLDFRIRFHWGSKVCLAITDWLDERKKSNRIQKPFLFMNEDCVEDQRKKVDSQANLILHKYSDYFAYFIVPLFSQKFNTQKLSFLKIQDYLQTLLEIQENLAFKIGKFLQSLKQENSEKLAQKQFKDPEEADELMVSVMSFTTVTQVIDLFKVKKKNQLEQQQKIIKKIVYLIMIPQISKATEKFINLSIEHRKTHDSKQTQIQYLNTEFQKLWLNKNSCKVCESPFYFFQFDAVFECQHAKICTNCLTEYAKSKINGFSEVKCPEENCQKSVHLKTKFYKDLPQNLRQKHKKIRNIDLVSQHQKLRLCPRQCEGIMVMSQTDNVVCPVCEIKFCSKCLNIYHEGRECTDNINDLLQSDFRFRRCQRCLQIVERISGCNQMSCVCRYQFCYGCGSQWSPSHYNCQVQPVQLNGHQERINRMNQIEKAKEEEKLKKMTDEYKEEEEQDPQLAEALRRSTLMYFEEMEERAEMQMRKEEEMKMEEFDEELKVAIAISRADQVERKRQEALKKMYKERGFII